jgi:hypothetical protein
LPVVDTSELDKTKAGSEIFPTAAQGKAVAVASKPEEKYVYRCGAVRCSVMCMQPLTVCPVRSGPVWSDLFWSGLV